ncbi:glycosyltransferase [Prosthecomicrobium pneumaticum]|uniref:GT2 family glycosyltransferase n=1 Tax=Prosthecomicrobium pneumaticum TaxID=81895 RepID=A0A7W9FPR5_9HYPH|nr:GT2 family glycosyltransferase [Prosthecomicrobium pneumaticum]
MIPKIIHQTWKSADVPEAFRAWQAGWRARHPDWDYRLWTDRDLLVFVAAHYPEHLASFTAYRNGVERADAARYMLLEHFGGVYADLDAECLAAFDPLLTERRVVLCREPGEKAREIGSSRGLPFLVFNGVMASPPGHPFWRHVRSRLEVARNAPDVLDSTGPCLLTGAYLSFAAPDTIRLAAANLFSPAAPAEATPDDDDGGGTFARHHWAGTWWRPPRGGRWHRARSAVLARLYRARIALFGGARLDPSATRAAVSREALARPLPEGDRIAILVPVRNAVEHLARFLDEIAALDLPKDKVKLAFCEGDSTDGTYEALERLVAPLRPHYRDILLLRHSVGTRFRHDRRWHPSVQRARRAGLARARNHLVDHGLAEDDDWALWIDVDVWRFPPDIVATLRAARARIVVPNCVLTPGGPSFDLNNFLTRPEPRDHRYYRAVRQGIYQPPANTWSRVHLSALRDLDRVPLDSVGGTMLLVDAALHRGGLRFPELPYDHLLETEGFGRLARDVGVTPIGLPGVEILHVPW